MSIVRTFNNLAPNKKRNVLIATAIALVFGVSWMLTSMTERKASKTPRAEKPEVTVVAPARTTGVEQFSAKLGVLEKSQDELKSRIERLLKQQEEMGAKNKRGDDLLAEADPSAADAIPALTPNTSVFEAPTSRPPALPPPPVVAAPPAIAGSAPQPSAPGAAEGAQAATSAPAAPGIRIIAESGEMDAAQAEEKVNKPQGRKAASEKAPESAFIPSGSMFTGVLLNGLDAPTSAVAQKNPTPVVIRVKREAVLPNYASIDVRECFLMAAGYGQLSSERALMRSENLSCVRHDGQVIESKLEAYIVGSDGKVGIPGRLVSKQGQMIAQSLIAGTLGGIGQSLGRSRVPSLNINPGAGQDIYQEDSVSSIAQGGLAGGLATSTNMIAKFYLDMAKETFPVVEVPAGEVATVIVTRGASLPLKGSTSLQKYASPDEKKKGGTAAPQASATVGAAEGVDPKDLQQRATASAVEMAERTAAVTKKATFENGIGW